MRANKTKKDNLAKPKKMDRRRFLKNSGVLLGSAALPIFIPARALGRDGHTSPGDRIVMASIGLGGQGRVDLRNFVHKDGVQFVAVCDVDRSHAIRGKSIVDSQYGNKDCVVFSDFRELLTSNDLDAVHMALPDHWHAIPAIAATKAGLDIYGQKPLTRTIYEGRVLCDTVKRHNTIWQTGSQQRSDEKFRFACELVRNGRLGKIHNVEVGIPGAKASYEKNIVQPVPSSLDWNFWLGPAPWTPYRGVCHNDWRHIRDYGFGGLPDWGAHHIDIAQWGLGTEHTGPVEVDGWGRFPRNGLFNVPVDFKIHYVYANGIKMTVTNMGVKGGTTFFGEFGWVNVNRSAITAEPESLLKERIGPDEIHLYKSRDHYQNFLDCVKNRKQPIAPAETGHRSNSISILGEISMLTDRKLRWNPEKERFIGDDEANRFLSRAMRSPWTV
ncbi:MAG: Gfo/Idh/MocA family oxidoreductase [Candidatus Marinimicrobia bacterium]|nr:Gfo/Idh/MocA family oxidoreductase [Candidatus Neomarinimicrobiota bacterium]